MANKNGKKTVDTITHEKARRKNIPTAEFHSVMGKEEQAPVRIYNTERHILYVACTRARDYLIVTAVAPASEFLDDLRM
jgi:ATP-dependent exoDNAse (exonuclease V) beta subunit